MAASKKPAPILPIPEPTLQLGRRTIEIGDTVKVTTPGKNSWKGVFRGWFPDAVPPYADIIGGPAGRSLWRSITIDRIQPMPKTRGA